MAANTEFFEALSALAAEKGVSKDSLVEKIQAAIVHAVRRDYGGADNIHVDIDPENEVFKIYIRKTVVEEVTDPDTELSLEQGRAYRSRCRIGSVIDIPVKPKNFGRIAAVNAKHVIRQGVKEVERNQVFEELQSKQGELVSAVVNRVDPVRGSAVLLIGKSEAVLPKNEMVPGEVLVEGQHIKVYVVDVEVTDRGPRVLISRTHPGLVKRLFENEVPEIFDGTVEIKGIAVYSKDPNVDPRGACIGTRGARVANIVDELGGEKIDIILWSEDPTKYVAEALSPANVLSVTLAEGDQKA